MLLYIKILLASSEEILLISCGKLLASLFPEKISSILTGMEYVIYNAAVPPFSDQYGENYKTITSSVFVNKKNCIYLYLCMGTYMNTAGLGI